MGLDISPENVTAVLLADGWHDVEGSSFKVNSSWGFAAAADATPGSDYDAGAGFMFRSSRNDGFIDTTVSGPIGSILAVREDARKKSSSR